MFARRDRPPATRFLAIRIGLLFLGAGIWVAGVLGENYGWTGVAIVVILAGVVLGIVARRGEERAGEELDDGDEADDPGPEPD